MFRSLGNVDQALAEVSECFCIREQVMPKHINTGLTAHKMGEIDLQRGDISSAMYV